MKRISVVGCSGSGKTTLARLLARRLGAPHVELDALHHLPGWTPRPRDEMRALVSERLRDDRWIVDGNYGSKVRDLVWARADTVIWLDLSRALTMWRIVRRSVLRAATREELWNGNRERFAALVSRVPDENIVLWAWTRHPKYRADYRAAMRDPAHGHLRFVRLASPRAVTRFVANL